MEAMKQGSATVGIKSNTHAVLVALKVFLYGNIIASNLLLTNFSKLCINHIYRRICGNFV